MYPRKVKSSHLNIFANQFLKLQLVQYFKSIWPALVPPALFPLLQKKSLYSESPDAGRLHENVKLCFSKNSFCRVNITDFSLYLVTHDLCLSEYCEQQDLVQIHVSCCTGHHFHKKESLTCHPKVLEKMIDLTLRPCL